MRANVKITWTGNLVTKEARKAAKKAIGDACEYILQESNKVVPFDEGTLQKSGDTDVQVDSDGVAGSVFYDTPYAIKVHEHPEYNFQNGREGKYLEKVIEQEAEAVSKFLETEYKKTLR